MPEPQAVINARRYVEKLERKAGPALTAPHQVRRELNLAEIEAASEPHIKSFAERAQAGRRITRLAVQLGAAERLPAARRRLVEREEFAGAIA